MAGETGVKALKRLREEGQRYTLKEVKDMLAANDYNVSIPTLSEVENDHRPCSGNLEKALVKLHNTKFSKGKLVIPKEDAA